MDKLWVKNLASMLGGGLNFVLAAIGNAVRKTLKPTTKPSLKFSNQRSGSAGHKGANTVSPV